MARSSLWSFSDHKTRLFYKFVFIPMRHVCPGDLSLNFSTLVICGPGSSVGIATDYGLDGPGSNPSGDEIFRLSRLALRPTQPPVKWVPCLSRG